MDDAELQKYFPLPHEENIEDVKTAAYATSESNFKLRGTINDLHAEIKMLQEILILKKKLAELC